MRLTTFTDYSLRVLIYVAAKSEGKTTIQEVAQRYGVSKNHLMKVVQVLNQRGYLLATRGKNGGLSLNMPVQDINIGSLVRDVENDMALAECFAPDSQCIISPACGLAPIFAEALNAFLAVLDNYTLADIVTGPSQAQLLKILDIQ